MLRQFLLVAAILATISAHSQSYQKIHKKAVLADTHNDVLSEAGLEGKDISHRLTEGHSDLERFREGGVDLQFF